MQREANRDRCVNPVGLGGRGDGFLGSGRNTALPERIAL